MERRPLFTADATVTAGRSRHSEGAEKLARANCVVPYAHAMRSNVDVALTVNASLERPHGN